MSASGARSASVGLGVPGSFKPSASPNPFVMGQFSVPGSKLTSEERFMVSSGVRSGGDESELDSLVPMLPIATAKISVHRNSCVHSPFLAVFFLTSPRIVIALHMFFFLKMSRGSTASGRTPTQLPSQSAWAKGPPQNSNSSEPSPRSQSPALSHVQSISASHSRRPSALGQGVSVKEGVGVPRNNVGSVRRGMFVAQPSTRHSRFFQDPP